jgi:hypothetical protein
MTPVHPTSCPDGATRLIFAKDQPEYTPLPATRTTDGVVCTEWVLTDAERDHLLTGGRLRILLHTFNQPLQPLRVEVVEPECGMRES